MTKIEWVRNSDGTQGKTWNPVTGCTKISEGCRNCYAERMARRLAGRYGYPEVPHHFDVTLRPDRLNVPLERKKPTTYFVCSMSDLFHKDVSPWFVCEVWQTMRKCPQHTFQILTKRPGRALRLIKTYIADHEFGIEPLSNICLGVSAETQTTADERIPILLQIPAAARFVSCEPLLGAIDLENYLGIWTNGVIDPHQMLVVNEPMTPNLFTALARPRDATIYEQQLSWIIVGGESGPGARPMHPQWARNIRDQCQASGTPYFFKQHGAWIHSSQLPINITLTDLARARKHFWGYPPRNMSYHVGKKAAGRILDGRTWDEMPRE